MSETARLVAEEMAKFLEQTHLPRIERALGVLPEGDLWFRPHAGVISFGNILLHLEGNVRQWICSGIGGLDDDRDRASEFAAEEGAGSGAELFERLAVTVRRAAAIVRAMDEAALERRYPIQGDEVSGVYAVSHVVEHFAWHTGQAVWIAKARAGKSHGLAFFDDDRVNAARNG